ncbi:hypothetical protein [uncultured Sulfitobacter sp.]|uniref:hypothetical protein n=1 Tax=uncultured Sulfitobacter sp. TaxID=191468 RepID=UPI0026146B47|nr:hypothetical protein [uncultured Sulfitobacter sp.]
MARTEPRKPRPKADPVDPTDHAQNPDTRAGTDPATEQRKQIDAQGEVRAGPGDANATRLPDDAAGKRGGRSVFIALLIAGPALVLLFWLFAG